MKLLLSCEHGGHRVPPAYAALFVGQAAVLRSHRGWDAGAAGLARHLAAHLAPHLVAPCQVQRVTRLLVDCNRSPHHRQLFSELSGRLPAAARHRLLRRVYLSHRQAVAQAVAQAPRPLLHLAVHSFTPVLRGRRRRADVGLLFDPRRRREAAVAATLQRALQKELPGWRILRNAPYRGIADGLPTALRRLYGDAAYAGLEVEVNQARVADPAVRHALCRALAALLR